MKKFLFLLVWLLSLIATSLYIYERPELIEGIKYYFVELKKPNIKKEVSSEVHKVLANSFAVEFSNIISLSEKTAFIVHDENILNFDEDSLRIYTQNGYLIKNFKSQKLNLPNVFTLLRNGGVKTIFIHNNYDFALMSSSKGKCFYASIVSLNDSKEIFKTKCLNDKKKNIDFNGLGSSSIHFNDQIFLSVGTPEQKSSKIRALAQDVNSMYGKILKINKEDLDKIIESPNSDIELEIFSTGHRNPQGITKINEFIFSVEHGPKGGDELNKLIEGKNYGWPKVSYGTQYFYDENGKSFKISHEVNKFEEPLFALVPSVGISSLNTCPLKLKDYYKKPCLIALSLYGNDQRPGKSLIIYLLNEKMSKVHSIEKIFIRDDLKLRHFVTNSKNELYEDKNGSIYVSADRKGIYKISFVDFRN